MGPGFLDHVPGATAEDFPSNIQAIRAFMRGCTSRPLPSEDYEVALCWNIVVQPRVRGALVTRVINSDDVLADLTKPVLMTQGRSDTVILPAMGDHILRTCRTSAASWYDDVGHMPFNLKYRDPDVLFGAKPNTGYHRAFFLAAARTGGLAGT